MTLLLIAAPAGAQRVGDAAHQNVQRLRTMLESTGSSIDLAQLKLTIDAMVDPSADQVATARQLDAMAAEVRSRLPTNATNRSAAEALRVYLYDKGPWNDYKPFRYDMQDPLGRDVRNKLLATYLATKKGNCVSMPLLFIVLGQKVGLDVRAARAPEHVFVKVGDGDGGFINFEATSGGIKSDVSFQRDLAIAPQAIANGVYLRPLGKRETVALLISTLTEFYAASGKQTARVASASLALELDPTDVSSMLHMSAAYSGLLQGRAAAGGPITDGTAQAERSSAQSALRQSAGAWRERAEALGWREPAKEREDAYLQDIQRQTVRR